MSVAQSSPIRTMNPTTAHRAGDQLLQVSGLSKHFAGLKAVSEVSFSVEKGEIVGLIGPNGAGKTTLFNCVAGAFAPTAGSIKFDGQEIAGLESSRIARRGLARTYQNLRVFSDMTVFDNVSTGAIGRIGTSLWSALAPGLSKHKEEQIAEATLEALRTFDLIEFADQPAGNLSYGQKKNLEMARAMSLKPKLLMLDEPAAGLNDTETAQLAERVMALRDSGLTIMLVEHDMPMVMRVCERIVVLETGKLIANGDPASIRNDKAVRAAYLGEDQ
ncbi:MAG: ABC transporter ATP-binding protein [Ottowia sp.]|uniref:ABC transporter ATP-binding protein n=1 Tax=Ottowia sp. TaxID=1898956 RepID=UPI0039E60EBB